MNAGAAVKRLVERAEPEALPLRAMIRAHSMKLGKTLAAHLEQVFASADGKVFRTLGPAEVARLLGIQESTLREFARENGIGQQEKAGRRIYTVEDLNVLRQKLEAGARQKGKYVPQRSGADGIRRFDANQVLVAGHEIDRRQRTGAEALVELRGRNLHGFDDAREGRARQP